ncbi:MAG: HlyC/CorC family transporter [Planctomycetes bacterium]|nr:HlyC/CorC family transporter [Planctomycetota bacterium]
MLQAVSRAHRSTAASRTAAEPRLPGWAALCLGPLPPGTAEAEAQATISAPHLGLCIAAVALAGLGALAAASLIGYSRTLLAEQLEEENRGDREAVREDLERRDAEYLTVAMTFTAAGWIVGLWALGKAFGPAWQHGALAGFAGAMVLVAGCLPTAIAQVRAERVLMAVRPVVRGGWWVLRWPLVVPLLALTRACLWLLRIRRTERADPAAVQKQVITAVADSVTEDDLPDEERTWIGNIVALQDLQVSAVMRPRPDLVAFAAATPLREAVQQALEHGYSRYPVYEQRLDEVVGIFFVKDALRLLQDDGKAGDVPVRTLLREPLFVPEAMAVAQLLRRFQKSHQHMAIVLDEYGATAGLVSTEDVLEQIVGEIGDENATPGEPPEPEDRIEVVEAGRVLEVPARTSVAEVNRRLGTDLPEQGDWETVAGFVIAQCSRIPAVGETLVIGSAEFRVLAADERRIHRLRVTALEVETAEGAN